MKQLSVICTAMIITLSAIMPSRGVWRIVGNCWSDTPTCPHNTTSVPQGNDCYTECDPEKLPGVRSCCACCCGGMTEVVIYRCIQYDSQGNNPKCIEIETCLDCGAHNWQNHTTTGYQRGVEPCNNNNPIYRCADGWWGSTVNCPGGTNCSGCTQCPEADFRTGSSTGPFVRGTNAAGGNWGRNTCRIPAGTYYDSTGTFTIDACNAN